MDPERWQDLMARLGLPSAPETYKELVAAYSQSHRHYHTGVHIEACLLELDEAQGTERGRDRIELALWFHDAVYRPTSSSNERDSAEWAKRFLRAGGAEEGLVASVYDGIMATCHATVPNVESSKWVVDVDLSILGRPPKEYAQFEENIRREYSWVPKRLFRRKRAAILRSFLERPKIYQTEWFRSRYERRARENLAEAIAGLRA